MLQQAPYVPVAKDTVLDAMDRVFRRLVRFGFCGPAGALWNHARLIPLKKQDGVGVRPIAVGEIMRRIAGKLALRSLGDAATASLLPHQYGVGRRAGADAVLLGARLALFDGAGTTAALKIDLHNAFNQVSRVWVRNVVQSRFEELWPLVRSTYSDPPALRVGDEIIASACGVQQGDPLGPLLFSLVLHTVLQDIGAPDVQHFWYLDDGLVVGTPAQLAGFLAAFEMCGSAKGLHINRAKTQLVLPAGVAASEAGPFPGLTDLPVVEWSSAQLLGAPLDASGTSESLVPLHALAAHVVALAERVARLPNPELAFHLLRGSVGPRRLAYLARVMPPGVMDALFRTFDHQRACTWAGLSGCSPTTATTLDRTPEGVVAPSYARWEALHCADALALSAAGALQDDDEPEALLTSQARGTNRFYHNLQRDCMGIDIAVVVPGTGAGFAGSAIAREVRVKLSEYAAHTPDPPAAGTGVTFVPLVFDVYGRVHAGTGPFFKDLAAAYQRTHEVGHRLASAALRRALSLGIYRAAGSAIVLRHTRHRPSVAARQWLSAGALTLATSSVHTESDD
ncbi:Retrotransposable element [Porphyridium purpureum]|uniref:Retrotransposable element n=1 Tax=Porphyridium purpureum TaxID=35688 RepID=A0A5J4YHV3_PORPP|nr:Retrotransposable element [Porphyridium purpureum]|eukprot:POR2181..scf218_34